MSRSGRSCSFFAGLIELEWVSTWRARKLPRTRRTRSSCASRLLVKSGFRPCLPRPTVLTSSQAPVIFVKRIWYSDQPSRCTQEKTWIRDYKPNCLIYIKQITNMAYFWAKIYNKTNINYAERISVIFKQTFLLWLHFISAGIYESLRHPWNWK